MPIVMVGGEKGGSGKSTVATNLAVYFAKAGVDVMLLDADPQGTSTKFIDRRNKAKIAPTVHCASRTGDIYDAALDMAKRYELVVIDAGGRDSEELRTGLVAADLVYVPLRASQADLETLPKVNKLIKLAKGLNRTMRAFALVAMAPTNPVINEAREAQELIAEFDALELAPIMVRDRKVYRDALLEGKGVVECDNSAAKAEVQLFGQEIAELLQMEDA